MVAIEAVCGLETPRIGDCGEARPGGGGKLQFGEGRFFANERPCVDIFVV